MVRVKLHIHVPSTSLFFIPLKMGSIQSYGTVYNNIKKIKGATDKTATLTVRVNEA